MSNIIYPSTPQNQPQIDWVKLRNDSDGADNLGDGEIHKTIEQCVIEEWREIESDPDRHRERVLSMLGGRMATAEWSGHSPDVVCPIDCELEETEDEIADPPPPPEPERQTRFRTRAQSRDLPPPVYLVQDLIEEGADTVIYGDSESLKSFYALAICGALVTGRPALGQFAVPNTGMVFYFAAEGRRGMEQKRLTAWEVDNGFAPFSLEDLLIGDAVYMIDDKDVEEAILDIERHLGERKGQIPILFVIDTLSRALDGQDEDKANIAAKYLNNVKKIKDRIQRSTSMTVAHTGKDRARGLRGSSCYFAGADTVLAVATNQDPDSLLHTSELTVEKQKDGVTGRQYWFESREVEVPDGKSLVLDPMDEQDGKKGMHKKRALRYDDVFAALKVLAPNGTPVSKRQVASKVAAMLGDISVDGVEKSLDRGKDKAEADTYKNLRDGKQFRLPSWALGADQTIADQIAELRQDDEARKVREQMESLFPKNDGGTNADGIASDGKMMA